MAVSRFERFFRLAAGLDVAKNDVKRYTDFVNDKLYDMLLMAQAVAKANVRDIIQFRDLPITKGLQESIHRFRKLDADVELEPILEYLAARAPLDVSLSDEAEAHLPLIVGGLSEALARTFKIIDPDVRLVSADDWERAFAIFRLLL
ncbi:MAG TPA: DUF1931 family protein [Streptosporangiaceae bacterium]|nr:DUF1931 family protein [Streptosporangiaceae bacterium]